MSTMPVEISTVRNLVDEVPSFPESPDAKVSRILFFPDQPGRQGEGGLRMQGKFKKPMPEKPLVSILTVVFNGAQYLEQTILSVLKQDYENIEFIVIDGGSTDGTLDILRKYENAIDYWISEPDRGISDAFNKAVQLSAGDYLNFQGAGDLLVGGDAVSRMMEGVDAQRDMLISGRVQRIREHDPNEVLWVAPRRFSPSFNKRTLLFRMSLPHQGLLTNWRMFERYGLFDTDNVFSMDYEHLLRAYNEFPSVVMRDVIFSAWREGGIGLGRYAEILREYSKIKKKNKVAPTVVLELIGVWSYFKLLARTILGKKD
ncbi:MAG TPA: glycosyltransferase family 2 protein [Sideroxyarcus sp.]|nr:glycosyltransferase family 2 protein [Sideroxyarcus sp.]